MRWRVCRFGVHWRGLNGRYPPRPTVVLSSAIEGRTVGGGGGGLSNTFLRLERGGGGCDRHTQQNTGRNIFSEHFWRHHHFLRTNMRCPPFFILGPALQKRTRGPICMICAFIRCCALRRKARFALAVGAFSSNTSPRTLPVDDHVCRGPDVRIQALGDPNFPRFFSVEYNDTDNAQMRLYKRLTQELLWNDPQDGETVFTPTSAVRVRLSWAIPCTAFPLSSQKSSKADKAPNQRMYLKQSTEREIQPNKWVVCECVRVFSPIVV